MAFWINETVEDILKRKEKTYLITDYKTPSGKIHVGALRGVIIHDAINIGLSEAKKISEYWYGFDDFDPIDSLTEDLKKDFLKYMGVPLCNAPSPIKGYSNFAEYYAKEFIEIYRNLGVKSETVWASELYKKGVYNEAIEIVLNHAKEIREIYKEVSGGEKPADWYPFQVVCPKCGKIGTTKVTSWDGKEVGFTCEPKMVDWAEGCGYKGKMSPYNGAGKMPYKVETPAKWYTFHTSVELAGKDHYTKGGSFDIAKKIAENVFNIKPAFGFGYEWFLVGGKKMSTSKGVGVSAGEISSLLPGELLRFLMIRTRAKRSIEFDVNGDTIPLLYDEFDRCIDEYLKDKKSDLGLAYHYAKISSTKVPKYRLRFSKIVYLMQMFRTSMEEYAKEEKGSRLTVDELNELKTREKYAQMWLEQYAPEKYKFTIQDKLPKEAKNLNQSQKEFLKAIISKIEEKKYKGEELHAVLHDIKKELDLDPRSAFQAVYLTILGKDSGPQAGWLIASLDKDFIVKRFKEAVNA